eukprot:COSAG01_NODE_16442_length_1236_cov_1.753738_1_plen_302_part_00
MWRALFALLLGVASLSRTADAQACQAGGRCGPLHNNCVCTATLGPSVAVYCNEDNGWCGVTTAHRDAQISTAFGLIPGGAASACQAGRCGPLHNNCMCSGTYSGPNAVEYCNEDNGWCGVTSAHQNAQISDAYDYIPNGAGCYAGRCGPLFNQCMCSGTGSGPNAPEYCNEDSGWCGTSAAHRDAQVSTVYDFVPGATTPTCQAGRCGPLFNHCMCAGTYSGPDAPEYCNEDNGWCGVLAAHADAQPSTTYDYVPDATVVSAVGCTSTLAKLNILTTHNCPAAGPGGLVRGQRYHARCLNT